MEWPACQVVSFLSLEVCQQREDGCDWEAARQGGGSEFADSVLEQWIPNLVLCVGIFSKEDSSTVVQISCQKCATACVFYKAL